MTRAHLPPAGGTSHGIRAPRMRVHPNGLLNFASDEAVEGHDPYSMDTAAAKPRRRRRLLPIQSVIESPHREPMRDAFAKELQSEARAQLRRDASRRKLTRSTAALATPAQLPSSPEAATAERSLRGSKSTQAGAFRIAGRPDAARLGRADRAVMLRREKPAPASEPLTYIPHTRVIPAVAARPHWRAPGRGHRQPTPEPASPPVAATAHRGSPFRGAAPGRSPVQRLQPVRARPGGDRGGAPPALPPSSQQQQQQAKYFGVRMERITIDGATATAGRAALGTSYGTRRTRDMLVSVVSHGPVPLARADLAPSAMHGRSYPT